MMVPFMCFSQITPSTDIPLNNILKEKENFDTKRKSPFNLEEIKVRWKKAALENCLGVPCVTTTVSGAPTSVTATAGNASASVAFTAPASDGGSPITGYTVTSSPGNFTATGATSPINVTGLTNGTAYTFTVVATNAVGNSVASSASAAVTPAAPFSCGTSTINDRDMNTYNTILIDAQCWTTQNLKVTKYNDGTSIPLNNTGGSAGNMSQTWSSQTTGAYTIYANEPSTGTNATNYGFLYNWFAVNDSRKLCPDGWHVPTDEEWTTLTTYLGGILVAGGKMKSTDTQPTTGGWNDPNTGADNSSGFSALPGGSRSGSAGSFSVIKDAAFFWSATEFATSSTPSSAT